MNPFDVSIIEVVMVGIILFIGLAMTPYLETDKKTGNLYVWVWFKKHLIATVG